MWEQAGSEPATNRQRERRQLPFHEVEARGEGQEDDLALARLPALFTNLDITSEGSNTDLVHRMSDDQLMTIGMHMKIQKKVLKFANTIVHRRPDDSVSNESNSDSASGSQEDTGRDARPEPRSRETTRLSPTPLCSGPPLWAYPGYRYSSPRQSPPADTRSFPPPRVETSRHYGPYGPEEVPYPDHRGSTGAFLGSEFSYTPGPLPADPYFTDLGSSSHQSGRFKNLYKHNVPNTRLSSFVPPPSPGKILVNGHPLGTMRSAEPLSQRSAPYIEPHPGSDSEWETPKQVHVSGESSDDDARIGVQQERKQKIDLFVEAASQFIENNKRSKGFSHARYVHPLGYDPDNHRLRLDRHDTREQGASTEPRSRPQHTPPVVIRRLPATRNGVRASQESPSSTRAMSDGSMSDNERPDRFGALWAPSEASPGTNIRYDASWKQPPPNAGPHASALDPWFGTEISRRERRETEAMRSKERKQDLNRRAHQKHRYVEPPLLYSSDEDPVYIIVKEMQEEREQEEREKARREREALNKANKLRRVSGV